MLKQGEINHPQGFEIKRIAQSETVSHLQAQVVHLASGGVQISTQHHHQVAGFSTTGSGPLLEVFLIEKLIYRRTQGSIGFDAAPDQTFGSCLRAFYKLREFIELLARIGCSAFGIDGQDCLSQVEHREAFPFRNCRNIAELQIETQIGFIATVEAHGVVVLHAGHFR